MKLEEAKARLRQRYLDGFPAKIAVLEAAKDCASDAEAAAIRRLAHQISGSAASFGYPELGAIAKSTELASSTELSEEADKLLAHLKGLTQAPQARIEVIIIDDDISICEQVEASLIPERYSVVRAHSIAEAEKLLPSRAWDVVLLDLYLRDGDGRDLLAKIRNGGIVGEPAVIVLSASVTPLVIRECAVYGVHSFMEKPIDSAALVSQIEATVDHHKTIQRAAYTDELTSLHNRSGFRLGFERLSALCLRNKRPMTVGLLDVDHFKSFNDQHGHSVGDKVLTAIAASLSATLRESDLIGRWGGEEFVVAFPETKVGDALIALEKVRQALKCDSSWNITFSAGVAAFAEEETLDLVLLRADELLYAAKHAGRDRVFDQLPSISAKPRLLLVEDDPDAAYLFAEDTKSHYTVTHHADGDEALAELAKESFDLIVLDFDLPGKTGLEIARALESGPSTAPVLFLTANGEEQNIELAFACGANDYVVKPYRKRELLARLARNLVRK